jgi:hypothetical protein
MVDVGVDDKLLDCDTCGSIIGVVFAVGVVLAVVDCGCERLFDTINISFRVILVAELTNGDKKKRI